MVGRRGADLPLGKYQGPRGKIDQPLRVVVPILVSLNPYR